MTRCMDFINPKNLTLFARPNSPFRSRPVIGQNEIAYLPVWQAKERFMTDISKAGTFKLGDRTVSRLGYGAMQLAGPGVFGPPKDPDAARAVLREAVANGVNHIDTSDFYGPHVTNQIIREALHPYPQDLVIVTKVSSRRGADGSWIPALSPQELTQAVHDNLRSMHGIHGPAEGSIEAPLAVLAGLQREGLIRHIGLSNVTPAQLVEGR